MMPWYGPAANAIGHDRVRGPAGQRGRAVTVRASLLASARNVAAGIAGQANITHDGGKDQQA